MVDFFDPSLGYAEYYLAKKHIELGLDVMVVCSNLPIGNHWNVAKMGREGFSIEGNIPVFRLGSTAKFRGNVWGFNPMALAKIIADFSPDIVNCRGLLSPLSQEVLLLKSKHHYSVVGDVITGHGADAFSKTAHVFMTKTIRYSLKYLLLNRVDAFFACNNEIDEWLRNALKLPAYRIFFVPLGADQELFKPDSRVKVENRSLLGISSNDIVAVYSGKLLPSKHIHILLMASKPVISQFKNFKIVLVGAGPLAYEERLNLLAEKLNIRSNVIVVKPVHRTKLKDYYNIADFAVWPGDFSISMLEAMACRLPIIIAESNWTKHYLEYMNGFSFKVGDISQLSQFLLRLVEDSQLRKSMGARSRKLIEDKLNWDCIALKHLEIYQSCLEQQSTRKLEKLEDA